MRTKLLIGGGLILAFVLGTVASSLTTTAFNKPEETAIVTPAPVVKPAVRTAARVAPAARPVVRPVTYVENTAPATTAKKRTLQKEILIVGGSAGAGAAIGAVAGGKKGAAVGALSGGVAGLIYDMATRNK
jgi:hypothetical protein